MKSLTALCEVSVIRSGDSSQMARHTWVGPRGNMDKAVFSATVIAVRSEQDEKALATTKLKQVPMTHEGEHVIAIGDEPDPPAQHLLEGLEPVTATKKAPAKHWRGKKKPELLKS